MSIVTKRMPSFEGVAAGQTASAKLPMGLSYHRLDLTYSGATLAQLNEIRLLINGSIHQRWVGASLIDAINKFDGLAAASGVLPLYVGDRVGLLTRQGREYTKIGTGALQDPRPITSMTVEVDIDAAAMNPALSLLALQSDPDVSGLIKHVQRRPYNVGGTGEFQIADINVSNREIGRLIFDETNVTIGGITVEKNGYIVFERSSAENERIQTDGERIPQAGLWIIDFSEMGYGTEVLGTADAQDLRLKIDISAGSGNMPVIVESYGPING